jgi:hypothetical protein
MGKQNKGKSESKYSGASVKLPKLSSNGLSTGFKGTFYQASPTSGPIFSPNMFNSSQFYDPNKLKQELSQNKSDMNAKKIELQELKIKFNKLYEDNKNNKNLLAKILGINLEKEFTRDELLDKLEHCKPSEEEKKLLREAHEIIKLKLEIEDKKRRIGEQGTELEILTKNAKSKVINELENDYIIKCEQYKNLVKAIKKMEELIKIKEKDITELESEYNYQKDYYSKLSNESKKSEENFEKSEKEKAKLKNEITEMTNKQKRIRDSLNKNKKDLDNNESLQQKKKQIEEINKYKEKRDKILKEIEEKKEKNKKLEKQKKDQEKEYEQLSKKNEELSQKLMNYNQERPKLEKKAIEPPKEQKRMVSLQNELEKLKKENEANLKQHEENKKNWKNRIKKKKMS